MGVGVTIEETWRGVVRVGVIKEHFQKIFDIGWVKAKIILKWLGRKGLTTPAPRKKY